jgi:hypothetical protein
VEQQAFNEYSGETHDLESSDEEDTEDEVDIAGDAVVRRKRLDVDAEDEEAYLEGDGEDDKAGDDDADDWTAEEGRSGGGHGPATAASSADADKTNGDGTKTTRPRDDDAAGPSKKRRVGAAGEGDGEGAADDQLQPQRKLHGLSPETKREIRDDLEKYLKRSSFKVPARPFVSLANR